MSREIAIIGAGGFIGKRLVTVLRQDTSNNLHLFGRHGAVEGGTGISPLDLSDTEALKALCSSVDITYYLASETIPASSWDNPTLDIDKNLKPFVKFLECAAGSRLKKVVFISSAGTIYGTTQGKVKEDADKRPFSPYGIIKLTMENFLEHFRQRHGLQYDIYRVSNVYGAGQNTRKGLGIINTFLERIIEGKNLVVFGDGSVIRNYIYVGDVAQVLATSALELDRSDIFNLSSDTTVSINELISVIRQVVREPIEVEYSGGRKSDNSFIDLDNSRLRKKFPELEFTDIKKGISLTYNSLKAKQEHQ